MGMSLLALWVLLIDGTVFDNTMLAMRGVKVLALWVPIVDSTSIDDEMLVVMGLWLRAPPALATASSVALVCFVPLLRFVFAACWWFALA